jgi:hypothetical protein
MPSQKKTSKAQPPEAAATVDKTSAPPAQKGDVSVGPVNLGHVFALHPKVNTSFPQAQFLKAKRELQDERFASIEEAARAVAEKALAAVHRKPSKHSIG